MKIVALGTALTVVCCLSFSGAAFAKGSGGGHGSGGHGSGGHASGGHASGGHGASGHASGPSHGSTASHGTAIARGPGSTPAAPAAGPTATTQSGRHPHDGQPVVGTAVPRPSVTSPFAAGPLTYAPLRVLPYSGIGLGFGGLGLYYNPFWLGGYGYGYSRYAYGYGSTWPYPAYGYAPYPFDTLGPMGSLRLRVEPKNAEVYVDGYYAGIVDEFDGYFQHLDLTPGPHHIEIRGPGYEPLIFDVAIRAHHKTEYRGTLLPARPPTVPREKPERWRPASP